MFAKKSLLFLLAVVFVIAGCSDQGDPTQPGSTGQQASAVIRGEISDGLIDFEFAAKVGEGGEDPIPGEYNLEVSSPGMERPLYTLEQFAMYVGDQVQMRLLAPVAGKRRVKGLLDAVEGEELVVKVGEEVLRVPFPQVDRANLVATFD